MNQYYIQFHIAGMLNSKVYSGYANIHPEDNAKDTTTKIIAKVLNDLNLGHLRTTEVIIEVLTKLN